MIPSSVLLLYAWALTTGWRVGVCFTTSQMSWFISYHARLVSYKSIAYTFRASINYARDAISFADPSPHSASPLCVSPRKRRRRPARLSPDPSATPRHATPVPPAEPVASTACAEFPL